MKKNINSFVGVFIFLITSMLIVSCSGDEGSSADKAQNSNTFSLEDRDWTLTHTAYETTEREVIPNDFLFEIRFRSDEQLVTGVDICNSFYADYNEPESPMPVGIVTASLVLCTHNRENEQELLDTQDFVWRVLHAEAEHEIVNGELIITAADSAQLYFVLSD